MHTDERNFFDEAIRIVKGQSLLQPQLEHLQALNDSRLYWREATMDKHGAQAALTLATERRAS